MAKLEVFQNGNFASGEPVYQIGTKYPNGEIGEYGEYDIVVFNPMTKSEADAKLAEMQPVKKAAAKAKPCLLYTSPSPRDRTRSRMPSSA